MPVYQKPALPSQPSQQTDACVPSGAQPSCWQPHTTAVVLSVLFLICRSGFSVAFHRIWNTFCVRSRRALPSMLSQSHSCWTCPSPSHHSPGWPHSQITQQTVFPGHKDGVRNLLGEKMFCLRASQKATGECENSDALSSSETWSET